MVSRTLRGQGEVGIAGSLWRPWPSGVSQAAAPPDSRAAWHGTMHYFDGAFSGAFRLLVPREFPTSPTTLTSWYENSRSDHQ